MPIFKAKLSDGRTVTLEGDHKPTEEEILSAVQGYKPDKAPTPQSLESPKDEILAGVERAFAPIEAERKRQQGFPAYLEKNLLEPVNRALTFSPADIANEPRNYPEAAANEILKQVNLGNVGLIKGASMIAKVPGIAANAAKAAIGSLFAKQMTEAGAQAAGERLAGVPLTPEEKGALDAQIAIGALPAAGVVAAPKLLKGKDYASRIKSTEPVSELEVRPRMGEETPLRQQPEELTQAREPVRQEPQQGTEVPQEKVVATPLTPAEQAIEQARLAESEQGAKAETEPTVSEKQTIRHEEMEITGMGGGKVNISVRIRYDPELKEWLVTPEGHEAINNAKKLNRNDLEEEANEVITSFLNSKRPPKTIEDAWNQYRKYEGADSRQTPIVGKSYFTDAWNAFNKPKGQTLENKGPVPSEPAPTPSPVLPEGTLEKTVPATTETVPTISVTPKTVKTQEPLEILGTKENIKVNVPKGATVIRVTPKDKTKGQRVYFVSDLNSGKVTAAGGEYSKVEAGTIGKDKKFKPVKGEVTVEDKTPQKFPIGPGAMTPAELAERSAKGQITPPPNPPVAVDSGSVPSPEVVRANKDYNLFNRINSSQWIFYFGKLGEAAKSAWERMVLGEFKMRESVRRDIETFVDNTLKLLPRKYRKAGGQEFFKILDGKTFEQIRPEWEGKPGGEKVISASALIKKRLEEIRSEIRDIKRDSFKKYLMGMDKPTLQELFKKNINKDIDIGNYTKDSLSDALTLDQFPDDWGIADGSYLPHLFFGQWRVAAKLPGAESEQFVFRAKTPQEARLKIYDFVRSNPKFRDAQFTVGQDMVISADMIRLGDRRFWNLIDRIKKQGSEEVNPREAVMGIIGRKASKQKWWGSLKERMGYRGYEKDYRQVMTAYLNGFHRWRELTAVNRETQPLIEQVRREGRINAADRLDDILTNLWGRPAKSTREFDAFIRQIPLLRDYIKPLALDRWARFMNHAASLLTLRTVRFSLVNRLQPLQGLYPIIGERGMIDAKILQHTAEGRRLLDESGVSFDPGQYAGEYGTRGKVREAVERFSGERSNQELAFLAMYTHGQKLGLSHAEAVNYAKLRGQLMTQFTPLVSDTPALFEGPAGRVLFQFKRFPVKQVELTLNLARDRNVPAISRLLFSMATIGGLSFFMRQAWMDKEKQLRLKRELDKQVGQNVADGIMYGLPGLVGADISGSLVLGDEPFGENIYEKVARQLTGPSLSLGIETARNISATSRQPISPTQKALAIARKIPSLRPIPEIAGLLNGDVDITTPDGEVKMRRKVSDAIAGLGSFRSANEANTQLAVSGIIEIAKEQQQLKNQWYASTEPNRAKTLEAIQAFNLRWPEIAITQEDLRQYQNYRNRNSLKTDVERVARGKFSNLLPNAPKPARTAW